MGTRSLVLEPHGDGFRGRYCHWDGYPEGVGEALLSIVKRDGLEMARRVIIHEHTYWSSISGEVSPLDYRTSGEPKAIPTSGIIGDTMPSVMYPDDPRGGVYVIGYGEADLNSDTYFADQDNYNNWDWCEWNYLLADNGLWISRHEKDRPKWFQVVPWDAASVTVAAV